MKNSKSKKRKSPSRQRYEVRNPVVSFRMSKKDYARFEAIRQKLGLSHGDVFRNGLGVNEVKIRSEGEIRGEAYEQGKIEGFELAESIYKVTYQCSICREVIDVDTDEEKRAIKKYMRENGWGHADCVNRRY